MSIVYFSTIANGDSFTFDADSDTLVFNLLTVSAADISFESDDINTTFTVAGKTFTLLGFVPRQITKSNVTFDDGSLLLAGDDTTGTVADDSANTLTGGAGDDRLLGFGGKDTLLGGSGDDVLVGGGDNDSLDGGTGIDTASYSNATVGVTVSLAVTGPQATGQGSDTLVSIENLSGSAYGDTLTGNAGANDLRGHQGDDTLAGGDGNDTLTGGDDNDRLDGGAAWIPPPMPGRPPR